MPSIEGVDLLVQERLRMPNMELQLEGYRLTTAEILYRLPDHPSVLQTFVWQEFDLLPDFPMLKRFLDFWERSIEGRLHSVRVAGVRLITPSEARMVVDAGYLQ